MDFHSRTHGPQTKWCHAILPNDLCCLVSLSSISLTQCESQFDYFHPSAMTRPILMLGFSLDSSFPCMFPAGPSPLCCSLNQNLLLYSVCRAGQPQSLKQQQLFVFVCGPCPIFWHAEPELNQYGPLPGATQCFLLLERNSIWCYSSGFILSQISGIYRRFLLHLISYFGAPGVANEDNVQYCKKNWLHLAYQDHCTQSKML